MDDLDLDFGPAEAARRHLTATMYDSLLEVARLREYEFPELRDVVADFLLVNVTHRRGGTLAYFAPDRWELGETAMSEINLIADRSHTFPNLSRGEDVLVSLIHELAHLRAHHAGVKDTSTGGRYHNRRFGEIALALGLKVERTGDYRGLTTPGISVRYWDEYAHLIATLDDAMVLKVSSVARRRVREPSAAEPADTPGEAQVSKYVFASCACRTSSGNARTIRVASGSWSIDTIRCSDHGRKLCWNSHQGRCNHRP